MSPTNQAAWQIDKAVKPSQVKSAPYTSPQANEIVVKNYAVAINPVDVGIQELGNKIFPWLSYPTILGVDLAGEVVEVGSDASSRFKVGDRVIGAALGALPEINSPAQGAFQNYTVVIANVAAKIPSHLDYAQACVLPLAVATAASALFLKEYLGLQLPTFPAQQPTGKTVVIWGGSSSVGSNAIQLAVAAGYEVLTTASPKNYDYVKSLGASQAFDYKDEDVVQEIITALKDKQVAGAIAIGLGSLESCAHIVNKTNGSKFVADVMSPTLTKPLPEDLGVTSKFVMGSDLRKNEVGEAVYGDFLEKALEYGKYVAAPDPEIAGHGLEQIQYAHEAFKKGVSAKKIVVTL
ncbi:hypothetical protein INT43_003432 [Umbelopsis isabellina]|uniref:Enoyl reductase (ER) domain-containing protein n=1 Tax=Mortierella isabellina TaxID=91625 RepID=A0A8H7UGB2_MORIS|nr:hypothetical protein INT43_003432 [Umbelopsis isabellina]